MASKRRRIISDSDYDLSQMMKIRKLFFLYLIQMILMTVTILMLMTVMILNHSPEMMKSVQKKITYKLPKVMKRIKLA